MSPDDSILQNLLQNNIQWAQAVLEADPDFFKESAKTQSPQVSLPRFLSAFPWGASKSLY